MKKLVFLFLSVLISTIIFAQSAFTVYKTQLYQSNPWETKWNPMSEPQYVNMRIVVKTNKLLIAAKSPTTFQLSTEWKEIKESNFHGRRHSAYEMVNERNCFIEFLNYPNEGLMTIRIIYTDKSPQLMLVYYISNDD
jgi:hypothetical protein